VGATVVLSGVFASIVSIKSLSEAVGYTNEEAGGRYLLPVLLAWFVTMMTLFFVDPASSAPTLKVKPGKPARGGRNSKR
jgi:hypothetical protein